MTDTNSYRKWFYRSSLALLGIMAAYVVLQPQYNFAHWVPHNFLRSIGIPYSVLLSAESDADKLLHPILAFILTVLLFRSRFPLLKDSIYRPMMFMIAVMVTAEIVQFIVGRGYEISDLLLVLAGSILATLYLYRVDAK